MFPDQGNGVPEFDQVGQTTRQFIKGIPKVIRISLLLVFLGLVGRVAASRGSFFHGLSTFVLDIGILILIVWFVRLFIIPIVRKQQIVEEWSVLIGDGQQHAAEIVEQTQGLIVSSKAPNITMEEKEVAPGFIRGILGQRRPFLVISNSTNANLKSYEMYLSARDYGNSLQVCWYVIHWPSRAEVLLRLLLLVPFTNLLVLPIYVLMRLPRAQEAGLLDLDFFDLQDLKAYVTNAHHCALDAVDKLLLDLSQDPSKIERKSRGFLGIS